MDKCILFGGLEALGWYFGLVVACLRAHISFIVVLAELEGYAAWRADFGEAGCSSDSVVDGMNTTIKFTLALTKAASLVLIHCARLYWVNPVVYLSWHRQIVAIDVSFDPRASLTHVRHVEASGLEVHV
jgi:hypothetical protein